MLLLIFSIILIPFLFNKPFIFSFICQDSIIYALLVCLLFIRPVYNGDKKFNLKPFLISFFSGLFFILGILILPFVRKLSFDLEIQYLPVYFIEFLFSFLGIFGLGFFAYNFRNYGWNKNLLYRFIELGTGMFFILYPFIHAKAYIMIKAVVACSIIIHLLYLALWSFVKILKPIKIRKLARIREEVIAEYPDSPLKL